MSKYLTNKEKNSSTKFLTRLKCLQLFLSVHCRHYDQPTCFGSADVPWLLATSDRERAKAQRCVKSSIRPMGCKES